MMDRIVETKGEQAEDRPYESPVIKTHTRDELNARATPINACTTFDPLED